MKMLGQTIEDFSIGLGVLLYMRLDNTHKNVNIKTSDDKIVQSHSILLAAVSQKFKKVFEENEFGVYHLNTPQVSAHTWKMMLDFLYTGQIHLPKDAQEFEGLVTACQGLEFTPLLTYLDLHNDDDTTDDSQTVISDASGYSRSRKPGSVVVSRASNGIAGTAADSSDDDDDYKCEICHKHYGSPQALNSHRGHHKRASGSYLPHSLRAEGDHECNICGQRFISAQSLAGHKGYHTRKIKCGTCGKTFLTMAGLSSHEKIHMKNAGSDTESSDKENSQEEDSSETSSSSEEEDSDAAADFECKLCHHKFTSLKSLQVHKGHHSRNPDLNSSQNSSSKPDPGSPSHDSNLSESQHQYVCPECNQSLPTRKALSSHMGYHSRPGANCPACNRKCFTKQNFIAHMAKCHKTYIYDIKKIKFKPKTSMTIAKGKVVKAKTKQAKLTLQKQRIKKLMGKSGANRSGGTWKCPVCSDAFKKPGLLHYHLKFDHPRKQWRVLAERKRMNKSFLPPHWTDLMDTKCQTCSKNFPDVTKVTEHYENIHKDGHPFKCNQCDLTFKNYKGLGLHGYVHYPEWMPFLCSQCDYTTSRYERLEAHYEKYHPGKACPKFLEEKGAAQVVKDNLEESDSDD